jgi:hypothetical protein
VAYSVQMQRMYDLANWTLNGDALSEEDKKKYEWDFDNGNWAGYKPPIGWSEVSGACLAAAGAVSLPCRRGARRSPTLWSFTTGTENAGTRT